MKVSINLLKQFTKLDIPDEEVVELVKEHIGEVDYYHNLEEDYKDIVIGQIKDKKDHPDADKLGIYKLDYGDKEEVQVVAGDKNLNVGDKVAYMKIGSTVPYSIYTEVKPFTIKSVKLRGVQSNGMMGSEKELNIGTNHERVMILPNDAPVGESFSKYYDLNDIVIDIENKALTNRGDLFGVLGIARELSAIVGQKFTSPDWYINPKKNIKHEKNCLKVEIVNDAEVLCPRYTALALDEINISQSPIWLKSALIKCGVKPINNVVDITNYIALLIGQPLHAFDYDKLLSNDPNNNDCAYINIRMAKHGEKILALDEKLYEPNEDTIVIADSTHPIGIAGVIGGKDTEVDENTKRIVLESANFDKSSIRRTSMKLGIFTEAATRFKHNLDTNMCIAGLLKAVELLKEISDCKIASNVIDIYNQKYEPKSIQFSTEDLNSTLGTQMDTSTVVSILQNLEYQVQKRNILYITPPSWRRDVEIKEDIYEDIGRIYGFNNINIVLPKKSIKPPLNNKIFSTKKIIRSTLSNKGANETLSYSFADIHSLEKCNLDSNLAYRIKNALSPELSLMRTCILQSLLSKAKENVERGIDRFALYEINIAHINNLTEESKLPVENWYASMVLTNNKKDNKKESSYYVAKRYLEYIFQSLNIPNIEYSLVSESTEINLPPYIKNVLGIFEPNTSAIVSIHGVIVGIVGEISNSVKKNFKLSGFTSGFEINIEELSKIKSVMVKYKEQPIYPSFSNDLCFEMNNEIKYSDIYNELKKILNSNDLWGRVECLDIYQDSKSEDKKRITFRITASNYSKTLKEKDIKNIISKIEKKLKEKSGIKLIT